MGILDKFRRTVGVTKSPLMKAEEMGIKLDKIGTNNERRLQFKNFLLFMDEISEDFKDKSEIEQQEIASEASWYLSQSEVMPFLSGGDKEKGAQVAFAYIDIYQMCKKATNAFKRIKDKPAYKYLKLDGASLRADQLTIGTILYTQSWKKEHQVPDQVWMQSNMFPGMGRKDEGMPQDKKLFDAMKLKMGEAIPGEGSDEKK